MFFSAPLVSSQRTCRAASCFVRIWDLSDKNKEKTVWNADIMAGFVLLAQYAFYPWFWNAVDYDGGNRRIVCICKCSANDWESDCPKPYIRSFRFGKRPRGIMQTEAEKDGVDLFLSSEKDTGCRCMAVLSVCGFCRSDCIFREPKTEDMWFTILFLVIAAFTVKKVWHYVLTPYGCIPVLNKIFQGKNCNLC